MVTAVDEQRSLSLSVPASRDMAVVLRLVARGVATVSDLLLDDIEALELAVAEAAALLLPLAGRSGELTMHVRFDQRVRISMAVEAIDPAAVLDRSQLSWHTLQRLDPDLRTAEDVMSVSVEFSRG